MLDMGAPPRYVPVKEGLFLLSILLIALIIYLHYIRMKKGNFKWDKTAIISIILSTALIITAFSYVFYEEPTYYFRDTYEIQIELVNSSDGYCMNEFWIEVNNNLASVHEYENMNITSIYGLSPGWFETIIIIKNDSAIFDGNDTLCLTSVFRYNNYILYYLNSTGNYTIYEKTGSDEFAIIFNNEGSYLEFRIGVYEGPV